MLSVKQLNIYYGRVQILWDISFEIKEGEICAIVGANGAGKSTLLNTISRILPIKSGSISFNGNEINRFLPHRIVELGLIQVPEGRRLFPSLTVLENLELGAYQGEAKQKRNKTLGKVYNLFPILNNRKNQAAGTLSGGEQQMLAIGRALMSLPKLLMLDEPSLGLAPLIVQQMFEVIKELNETGMTILLVEQNARKALSISDVGLVIENGKITIKGKGAEIANNEYTKKAFLGM
jgi:branched-chain amino acid transport system ATP-binding protein